MTDALVAAVKAAVEDGLNRSPMVDASASHIRSIHAAAIATAALQAIEAAGYRVVPVDATEAMILAAEDAAWDHDNHMPAIRAMRLAWSAMLSAAPRVGEGV